MPFGATVLGLNKFQRLLAAGALAASKPFTGANGAERAVVAAFHAEEERAFETEGQSQGRRWADLKESTRRNRRPGKILQQSKRLKRSLTSRRRDSVIVVSALKMELGTRVPYARYHQKGTPRMTDRPPIVATKKMAERLAKATFVSLIDRISR